MKNKKYFLLLLLLLLLFSFSNECETKKNNTDKYYYNIDCIIIDKYLVTLKNGRSDSFSKGFLLKTKINGVTFYREFFSINKSYMTDEYYYNHDIGDTLHFDKTSKDLFIKIKNK